MKIYKGLLTQVMIWPIVVVAATLFLTSCRQQRAKDLTLFDFESQEELDQLNWRCHVIYELNDQYVSHGQKSLKLEMYPPSRYPGMSTSSFEHDWRGYKKLCFDIFNPKKEGVSISFRLDDKKDHPSYADRINKSIKLKSGWNAICFELDSLRTSGTKRHLNLTNVTRLYMFTLNPERPLTLFLDNIRLTQ